MRDPWVWVWIGFFIFLAIIFWPRARKYEKSSWSDDTLWVPDPPKERPITTPYRRKAEARKTYTRPGWSPPVVIDVPPSTPWSIPIITSAPEDAGMRQEFSGGGGSFSGAGASGGWDAPSSSSCESSSSSSDSSSSSSSSDSCSSRGSSTE